MSEIKVNKISPKQTCTQLTLGDSGDTIIVPSGVNLNTDAIKNLNTSSIITQTNATTITLGYSGATIAIASGASQTGFGRTGTVNWDTTPKTTTVTAVSGVGYFINTTSGGVTVNLPAGSAGSIVALSDYAATWNTNAVTVNANGSEKIGGVAASASLNTQGQAVTFVYVDSTQGWTNVGDATKVQGNTFITATGGTVLTCGNYKTHVFTGPGTFTVTNAGTPAGSNTVEYLVVAGGGSGSKNDVGGGAGAGGYRQNYPSPTTAGLPVTAQAYPITVGAGGAAITPAGPAGNPGNNSIFSTITSTGGGGGGGNCFPSGRVGGSGGGAAHGGCTSIGAAGNTPPTSPPQGNPGGGGGLAGPQYGAGGGGGAGAAGTTGIPSAAGPGGVGSPIATTFFGPTAPSYGTPGPAPGRYFAGGGGGARDDSGTGGVGGAGGGGAGGSGNQCGVNGTTNTGGGGGGTGEQPATSGAGGSGIVVIRYKFQ